MPVTIEEIRRSVVEFALQWSLYSGSERSEAQTFLNGLFTCYGSDRRAVGARFEDPQEGKFLDLIWPRICLIEMKRPSEAARLAAHRRQALDYWEHSADPRRNVPAPRFVVLCAFQRFEVWEPGAFPGAPRTEFELRELPERAEALMFLAGRDPIFTATQAAVTREAVDLVTGLYRRLGDRRAAGPDVLRDFVLQSVWCMFAEDLGQIEGKLFSRLVDQLLANPQRSSADDLGLLFEWLNRDSPRPPGGLYADTRYVNGGLFDQPAHVHLDHDELAVLALACEYDWRKVEPHIFGSLLEGALGKEAQWALGAHYTHAADIQKVVQPSIVVPWRERIENAATLQEVQQLQHALLNFVVLDPACGSGNFLYVAYRELRRLERRLHDRERDLRKRAGLRTQDQTALSAFFPLQNIKGIELQPFAVALARVTLWMAHKLAVDEFDLSERTLPLEDLSGIRAGDALRVPWPAASVIIGNPPFHGDRHLRRLLGDGYVKWLEQTFECGIKDYCVYWFRKTHHHLSPGQRAGLVGTNSITQNRARPASVGHILDAEGVITSAVSTQDWPGAAAVDVSIVNWIKQPSQPVEHPVLDGKPLDEPIAASLRPTRYAVERAYPLAANDGRSFFGCIPGDLGFILDPKEAAALLDGKPPSWHDVVRPYLIGNDLTKDPEQLPSRWVIDFGRRTLEQAMEYPEALEIVRQRVKPARDKVRRSTYRHYWWRFKEPLKEMRAAIASFERYIASPAQAKRIQFSWVSARVCPSNLVTVFAFNDDYAMGVLSAFAHHAWLTAGWSTLEDRTRYTPSTVFATYPWPPQPTPAHRQAVADVARDVMTVRETLCREHHVGLTTLYNHLEDGAFAGLAKRHRLLDRAVAAAYGWSATAASEPPDATNERLLALNFAISAGQESYAPF
jgi:hypothetical protein